MGSGGICQSIFASPTTKTSVRRQRSRRLLDRDRLVGHDDGMKYVLLICDDETTSPTMEEIAADPAYRAFAAEVDRRGASIGGARLRPVADATTVRIRNGETLVSDGPFAETKDFIGGIDIIDCADLDDAIAIAARHPYASWGCIEIRPVWE
ncbi:YciI family protein [Nocardia sp. NPDC059180]|uniref:YciI family protein n=1 Tax=Nocardia sp. NPDC059180 TaxID=3346761 RepID=UPI0036AB0195